MAHGVYVKARLVSVFLNYCWHLLVLCDRRKLSNCNMHYRGAIRLQFMSLCGPVTS